MTQFPALATFLSREIGLDVESIGSSSLDHAVNTRISETKAESRDCYLELVRSSPEELDKLINSVIVQETWFFRDSEPFVFLRKYLLERHRSLMTSGCILRILSVPCASGEEPYSIAITLLESGYTPDRFLIEAVDISQTGLRKAQESKYCANSFREQFPELEKKYFACAGNTYTLNSEITSMVKFSQGNIIKPYFLLDRDAYDLIFCRNLIIYLTREARTILATNLDRLLMKDGLLFVGHSEMSTLLGLGFRGVSHSRSFALKRQESPKKEKSNSGNAVSDPPPPVRNLLVKQSFVFDSSAEKSLPGVKSLLDIDGTGKLTVLEKTEIQPSECREAFADSEQNREFDDLSGGFCADDEDICRKIRGVEGDYSCVRLKEFVHCRNCPVYSKSGKKLLDREIPLDYQADWTRILAEEKKGTVEDIFAVIVFRLRDEWIAMKAKIFQEITETFPIHSIPGRSGRKLLGLVNINGELIPCLSLAEILGIIPGGDGLYNFSRGKNRMVVVGSEKARFVFLVDEVLGIFRFSSEDRRKAPSTIEHSALPMISAVFLLDEKKVGLLDEEKIMEKLTWSLQRE